MRFCNEIQRQLEEAELCMKELADDIWEYGSTLDSGTFVNWVAAHRHWKDTVAELKLELATAHLALFADFVEKKKIS